MVSFSGGLRPAVRTRGQRPLAVRGGGQGMRLRTQIALGVSLAGVLAAMPALAVQIRSPRDGQTVRETVQIVVTRVGLPARGFVGLYVDGEFEGAQAPVSQ